LAEKLAECDVSNLPLTPSFIRRGNFASSILSMQFLPLMKGEARRGLDL